MAVVNGPAIWQPMLSDIRTIWPSAVVAGGAVRDFVIAGDKHRPADVDFFVSAEDQLDFELQIFDLRKSYPQAKLMSVGLSQEYEIGVDSGLEASQQTLGVIEGFDPFDGTKINVIAKASGAMSSYDDLFATFDHSLCDFAWQIGDDLPYRSREADVSIRTKQVMIRRDKARTIQRLESLVSRKPYADFTWKGKLDKSAGKRYSRELAKALRFIENYGGPVNIGPAIFQNANLWANDPLAEVAVQLNNNPMWR